MVSKIDLPQQIVRTLNPLVGITRARLHGAAAGSSVAGHSETNDFSGLVVQ